MLANSLWRLVAVAAALLALSTPAASQQQLAVDTLWATIHNHRIAFFVSGDAAAPVVILEPGGASHRAWGDLPAEIAKFARVVTYDRPGYGLSERCSRPRSASVIAEELQEALATLRITSPFVLGGWSLGGSFVRVFGAKYPGDVAGVVLIDPAPDNFYDRAAREHPDLWKRMLEEQNRRVATQEEGHRDEWAAWESTISEARRSDVALKAPVIVLTSTTPADEFQPIWIDEHRKWARGMNARHIVVEDSGHAIYRDKPEVVLRALREAVAATRRQP